jgi:hypothetical protein
MIALAKKELVGYSLHIGVSINKSCSAVIKEKPPNGGFFMATF